MRKEALLAELAERDTIKPVSSAREMNSPGKTMPGEGPSIAPRAQLRWSCDGPSPALGSAAETDFCQWLRAKQPPVVDVNYLDRTLSKWLCAQTVIVDARRLPIRSMSLRSCAYASRSPCATVTRHSGSFFDGNTAAGQVLATLGKASTCNSHRT